MDINNPQTYRRALREGNKSILCEDYKGIKWAEKELKRIEEINDLEEKAKEVKRIWEICDKVYLLVYNPPKEVNPSEHYGLNDFRKIYDKLKYLKNKPIKTNKNKDNQNQSDKENEIPFEAISSKTSENEDNNQLEYISCQQCFKEIKNGADYWYHKTKNDGYKFCSTDCYNEHYGEYCSKCVNENKNFTKYLTVIPDGDNTYCSACYELVKKEQKEKEEQETSYCKYCSTKLVKEGNLKYSLRICDKDDCLLKLDKELYPNKYINNSKDNNSNIINNNSHIRERERERANSLSTITITLPNSAIRI